MSPKHLLQRISNILGYDIYRRDGRFHSEICARSLATQEQLSLILDVGANVGQYGKALRQWGYNGKILSFEPLSQAHKELTKQASDDPNWNVAPRCAVGASASSTSINIAGNSVSSSLLEMLDIHRQAAPESEYTSKEEVLIRPLDDLVDELCQPSDRFFLKIDTQGYEKAVIEGALKTLKRTPAVQLELSLRPLYAGSLLLDEGIRLMTNLGYRTYAIFPGLADRASGESLQVDVVFLQNR